MSEGDTLANIEAIVCAPLRQDGPLLQQVLTQSGIKSRTVPATREGIEPLEQNNTILVCTQEGLTAAFHMALLERVRNQPRWSRLPMVFLLDRKQETSLIADELHELMQRGYVTVILRPMRPIEFNTAIENAIAARQAQLQIADHISYQEELQRELNHRVKNVMSTFMAIYQMTRRQSTDLDDFSKRFQGRMNALTSVHDLLHKTRDGQRNFKTVAENILAPYNDQNRKRIHLAGPRCELGQEAAMSLALLLNELTTNAAKYGALSTDAGKVDLQWEFTPDNQFILNWQERGGPLTVAPEHSGYGTRFIKTSARTLSGDVIFDYRKEGLHVLVSAPVDKL